MEDNQKIALINLAVFVLGFFLLFFVTGSALWGLFLALALSAGSDFFQRRDSNPVRQEL